MMDRRSQQRGFTLIELMVTLAVASIIIGIITRVVFVQQRSFMDQIAIAETQQNARASISLLKLYARKAGWGMTGDTAANGEVPLGACYSDADKTTQQLNCDRVDLDADSKKDVPNGSDRLRVVAIDSRTGAAVKGGGFVATPRDSPVGTVQVGLQNDPVLGSGIPSSYYEGLGQPLADDTLGLVSGPCIGGGGFGADLLTLQGAFANGDVYYEYSYLNLLGTGSALTCALGYRDTFTFGRAVVADFWIDRTTDLEHPILRLRTDPRDPLDGASSYPVAYDIDDLQIQYLLDTTCPDCSLPNTPDHVWDEVCDDITPTVAMTDGGCDPTKGAVTQGLTARQRLARVVGVRIAIVARTRNYNPKLDYADNSINTRLGGPLTVQNHTYVGRDDGYRRWIYRATVALRNNEL